MSLARAALRISVVHALRGRTLVGGNVLDSRIGVIEVGDAGAATSQGKPFIAVYTAGGETDIDEGRSLAANGRTWLVLELGVTAAMAVTNPETDESEIMPGIPATDEALELTLDLAVRGIANALNDPDNAWAEIYRGLSYRLTKMEVEPLRNGDDGQRLAARQIRIAVDLIEDPVSGDTAPEDGPLGPFIAALDALDDPIATSQADLFRIALGPADAADWRVLQRRRGMTAAELRALGRGPIEQDLLRETPLLTSGVIEADGIGAVLPVTP